MFYKNDCFFTLVLGDRHSLLCKLREDESCVSPTLPRLPAFVKQAGSSYSVVISKGNRKGSHSTIT